MTHEQKRPIRDPVQQPWLRDGIDIIGTEAKRGAARDGYSDRLLGARRKILPNPLPTR